MAIKRKASAKWEGTLKEGKGTMSFGTYTDLNYSFSRFKEDGEGTNPEELIGAAHAGCFSMAFNVSLERAGYKAKSVETDAEVMFDKLDEGWRITKIKLICNATVPDISEDEFMELANGAKEGCPISNALSAIDIELDANLNQ